MVINDSQLKDTISKIEKKYGEGAIHKGSDAHKIERISTGSLELDFITGGGIPKGRWSRAWGPWSSAKTLTCWNIIREAQKQGLSCAYYNVEKSFDREYVESLGVDIDNLYIIEGSDIEGIAGKIEALLQSINLHVIDTASAACSIDELKSDMEDWHMALNARVWSKALRKLGDRFDKDENIGIFVDQARIALSMYGGPEVPPGGKSIEHASSLTLHFRRGKWLYRTASGDLSDDKDKRENKSSSDPDGIEIQVRTEKSKVCVPLRSARLHLDFSIKNFDPYFELAKFAIYFGLAKASGSWYELPSGEKLQGKSGLRGKIIQDQKLCDEIRAETLLQA